jgi:hypothetical protein
MANEGDTQMTTPSRGEASDLAVALNTALASTDVPEINYDFHHFFHPYVDEIVSTLSKHSLDAVLNGPWQDKQRNELFFLATYGNPGAGSTITAHAKSLEVNASEPYANYNWEFFFHMPVTVAVHLSKTRRFAEAQRWFHFVFNPISTNREPAPKRFWNFLAFRNEETADRIEDLLLLLSTATDLDPTQVKKRDGILAVYAAALEKPFQPHVIARARQVAYQYSVVMKYLDSLLAWGDDLFRQDTIETINEATQLYVLAANILGPRPQRVPPVGSTKGLSYSEIKANKDAMGNALVALENAFPFEQFSGNLPTSTPGAGALLGIGRTLYFCVPRNDKLLSYWDQVADRLFKVRHCMNIEGIVRSLALFDAPIDPGMLVAAAGAGFDVSAILSGLHQQMGPMRGLWLMQKAIELCNEVRGLGGALLSAIEKGDSEHMALVRQGHEIKIQTMTRETRFLQWKSAEELTNSLLTSRAVTLQRLRYYQRLLGLPTDTNAPDAIEIQRPEKLTQGNFAEVLAKLVSQYDKPLAIQALPPLRLADGSSPSLQSGAEGGGRLYLNTNEHADLNIHSPKAHDFRIAASANDTISKPFAMIPDIDVDLHYWGLGAHTKVFGGSMLSLMAQMVSGALNTGAIIEESRAGNASKTASFERRADDWMLQYNQAARELMQNGRQIISSLLAEQVARHEYETADQQLANAGEINDLLESKFSNRELYLWMQGEISRLYYDYYRFAYETARRAEYAMKQELMRPELDAQTFVQFNYWDTGRKGLQAGEALLLDLKRMEMAYHDNNKRELEITKHISLRQLNAFELWKLRDGGTCTISVPDEVYALDFPSHYFRRIKSVSVSVPCVVGPYTSVSGTLGLGGSKLRTSPAGEAGPVGPVAVQSIATSTAANDSGLFEFNFRDERYLPFEGAGAASEWTFTLPQEFRAFDYSTISDLILHVRYTARDGGATAAGPAVTRVKSWLKTLQDTGPLCLLASLRQDFPLAWSALKQGGATAQASVALSDELFPYFVHGMSRTFGSPVAHALATDSNPIVVTASVATDQLKIELANAQDLGRLSDVFVVIPYSVRVS